MAPVLSIPNIILLIWVGLVSAWARGWTTTHAWIPNWVGIVGAIYIVVVLLLWLFGKSNVWVVKLPVRHQKAAVPVEPVV